MLVSHCKTSFTYKWSLCSSYSYLALIKQWYQIQEMQVHVVLFKKKKKKSAFSLNTTVRIFVLWAEWEGKRGNSDVGGRRGEHICD